MTVKVFGRRPPMFLADRVNGVSRTAGVGDAVQPRVAKSRSSRMETWASCTIFWVPDGLVKAICVDVSTTGARVKLRESAPVPSRVRLVSAQLGLNREAVLVRLDGFDAAFRFVE